MGVGHKTHGDPKAWAVHNNKLYLHQSAELRDKWLKDPDTYIKQAESNWAEKAQTRIDHNVDNTVTSKVLALIDKNINKQPDVKTEDATIKLDGQKDGKADENANTEKDKQIKELKAQIELAERDTNKADDLRSKGDLLGALKSYQDSISIIEPLASKASSVSELQAYLADLYYKVGKVFDTQNDRAGTITKWQKSVSLLEDIVSRFPDKAPKYKEKLASVLGNLSFNLLFSKSYQEALSAAHRALELEPSEYWIKTNEAHALLFLNRYDEAKLIYLEQPNKIVSSSGRSFRQAVIDDYSEFRKQGLNHPDMEKIENLLTKNDIPAKPNESGDEYSAY